MTRLKRRNNSKLLAQAIKKARRTRGYTGLSFSDVGNVFLNITGGELNIMDELKNLANPPAGVGKL